MFISMQICRLCNENDESTQNDDAGFTLRAIHCPYRSQLLPLPSAQAHGHRWRRPALLTAMLAAPCTWPSLVVPLLAPRLALPAPRPAVHSVARRLALPASMSAASSLARPAPRLARSASKLARPAPAPRHPP